MMSVNERVSPSRKLSWRQCPSINRLNGCERMNMNEYVKGVSVDKETELEVSVQDCMPLSNVKIPANTAWLQKSGRACMVVNF